MTDLSLSTADTAALSAPECNVGAGAQLPACDECLGSGGWFRYEPALEPSPGLLYLSCVHCRGSGVPVAARA